MGDILSKLEIKIKPIKPSLLSNNFAEKVANEELKKVDNFNTIKESYMDLWSQLETDGILKDNIIHEGRKIIIDKKRVIKKRQGASLEEIKQISIGSWYYDVANTTNYVIRPDTDEKIVPLTEYEKENINYIKVIKNTKDFLDVALKKLKQNHFMSLLDDDKKVLLALHDWQAHLDTANSYFDHKEKIPVNTQHILLHCIGTISSNNDVAIEYFKQRAKSQHLTGKQISKYRSGEIKTKLDIFNPKNRITAILWNYFGSQCNDCKSWRVLQLSQVTEKTKVKCQDCENIFFVNPTAKCNYCAFPFFEEDISFIKKGNKCPNCQKDIPEYLINQILI